MERKVLAFESSCDETAVAIYQFDEALPQRGKVLANIIYSQIPLHRQYGGVVPELAARDHIKRLPLLLQEALQEGQCNLQDIDFIAFTSGPGLQGALMTGASYARSLAYALNIPALPIHHMEGHLLSPLLDAPEIEFPFLALLVSGGHTQLLAVEALGQYKLLGQTLDDALGEAFDKTAKLMGLPYPGGAPLAKLAQSGNPYRYDLPRPMTQKAGLDFSFSGLKTQIRLIIEEALPEDYPDIAASFQMAVVDTICIKCRRAWNETKYRDLVVAGGVSANQLLREKLQQEALRLKKKVYFPDLKITGDNALMIAYTAALRYSAKIASESALNIDVRARWNLEHI